jgi:hypothetical protein
MDIKIGADPEFLLLSSSGSILSAGDYLGGRGILGTDGCSTLAEIRPQPNTNPLEVSKSIENILRSSETKSISKFKWIAGNGTSSYPTGGHIHISKADGSRFCSSEKSDLVYFLDIFIGMMYVKIYDKELFKLRLNNYGRLGDVRDGEVHSGIEYRTPASWIVSKPFAEATLCLAYCIAKTLLGYKTLKPDIKRKITILTAKMGGLRRVSSSTLIEESVEWWGNCWKIIPSFVGYKEYKRKLDYLLWVERVKGVWMDNKADIRQTWHFDFDYLKTLTAEQLWEKISGRK